MDRLIARSLRRAAGGLPTFDRVALDGGVTGGGIFLDHGLFAF